MTKAIVGALAGVVCVLSLLVLIRRGDEGRLLRHSAGDGQTGGALSPGPNAKTPAVPPPDASQAKADSPGASARVVQALPPLTIRTLAREPKSRRLLLQVAYVIQDDATPQRRSRRIETTWAPEGDLLVCWWDGALWRWSEQEGWRRLLSGLGSAHFLGWTSHPRRVLTEVDSGNGACHFVLLNPETGETRMLVNEDRLRECFSTQADQATGAEVEWPWQDDPVSPKGRLVALLFEHGQDTYVLFFDANGKTVGAKPPGFALRQASGSYGPFSGWSPDGTRLGVLCDNSRTMWIIEPATGSVKQERFRDYPGLGMWSPQSSLIALITTPDGVLGCTDAYGGTLSLFDCATGSVTRYHDLGAAQLPLWSPDGRYVAVATQDGADEGQGRFIGLFDSKAHRLLRVRPTVLAFRDFGCWSPDGHYFGFGDAIFERDTRKVARARPGQTYLPADAPKSSWVWRVIHDEYAGEVIGEWTKLGAPLGEGDRKGHLYFWLHYGSGKRTHIASDVEAAFWWSADQRKERPTGQIGRPPG